VVITFVAKFLYSAAMSLDGLIAGPDGDMSWSADYVGPNPVVNQLITETGAILLGHRTFGGDDPYKGQPGEPVPGVTIVGEIDTARAGRITNLWYRIAP
jgi:hypothetical protein